MNISPSIVSNNYVGPITLTIGNLTASQKVVIGEFLDANGNGTIDSGEYEVRHFAVTDGVQSILAGATNINVPGDTDGTANGQITVVLNYPGVNPTLSGIAANYLFKLSDPNGVFTPVTNSFTVRQQPATQGVSGTLTANGLPLANAVVVLVQQQGNGGGGTVTDANGNYSISNAPGTYFLVAAAPGYVGTPAQVNISPNSFSTVNLTASTATGSLTGNISDSSTGQGLPGLFVNAQCNTALTLGFTDTNGNFSLPAISNQWKIKIDTSAGLACVGPFGYVNLQNNSANFSGDNVSNINFSFPRATSLIYGYLKDNHSNPLAGTDIEAFSADNLYQVDTTTTATGQYAVGVFSNSWYIGPQNQSTNVIATSTNVSLVNGQAVRLDMQAQLITAYLYGKIVDQNGNPQANVGLAVNALDTNGFFLSQLNQNFSTASDGTFAVGLYGGKWNIAPECNGAGSSGLVPPNLTFNVTDGVNQSNIVMIERFATCTISGRIVDSHGNPVNAIAFASTIINGTNYSPCSLGNQNTNTFSIAVFPGTWVVGLSGNFNSDGYDNPPNQNVTVSSGTATANFVLYPIGQMPPQLTALNHSPGGFSFNVMGDPQQNYCVQVSTNLKTWQPLVTNTAYGGSFYFQDTNAAGPMRFYRAVLVP
ncbi:MAG TPA: carboxypeptidase-like regulatory domain-containing protein [Verrucomicrobiae bacterium]|nr:carboxypeptidase-like regulatory domain-containing protein [Verrucomicrobiae bacterium]